MIQTFYLLYFVYYSIVFYQKFFYTFALVLFIYCILGQKTAKWLYGWRRSQAATYLTTQIYGSITFSLNNFPKDTISLFTWSKQKWLF